ncbi:MAG: 4-(cytidine 5'-diphospho)-2-C-methyl-D-erythritol kinase [Terracidiphilus sp.]
MPTTVRSHAKVNLGLYVGAPREDGFHSLVTVYQTLELHDLVTVSARLASTTALRLSSNDGRVPTDERNTAWKMVELALEALGLAAEVEIHIEKRLPVQGGMGAGSANAVAALVGLETELNAGVRGQRSGVRAPGEPGNVGESHPSGKERPMDGAPSMVSGAPAGRIAELRDLGQSHPSGNERPMDGAPSMVSGAPAVVSGWNAERRLEIAAWVGSDVPLFLIGGTVLGVDRGQQVSALADIEPVWCVVAVPEIRVSTPQAFRDWDTLCAAEGLTAEASASKLRKLSRAYSIAFQGSNLEGVPGVGSSGVLLNEEDLAGPKESVLVRTGILSWIENDFERVVFSQHPTLRAIKQVLQSAGTPEAALHASLSGSGSALFGLYKSRGDAEKAQSRLREQFREVEVRTELTRTLPRSNYWREMVVEETD